MRRTRRRPAADVIITPDALELRKRAVAPGGPLAPLFDSLAAELEPWLGRKVYVPDAKALLSRVGGRCETDGSNLEFDPASPHQHRCPSCGRVYSGDLHHRAWVMPYQLWLAERAVHGALFFLLRGEIRHAMFARRVLTALAPRYEQYPNVDNVLGPSRLFFSTYLESVWLLQMCLAAHFLAIAGDEAIADMVVQRVANPARAMIAEFNEGHSNRQVWNNAALLSAAVLCGDREMLQDRAHGASGVAEHLAHALLPDGSWYEGENYHQFALRGLWYAVTMLEVQGIDLDVALRQRFDRAFTIPVVTALPDFTMPSRKDSQYAVSLRQWRLAELLELGLARRRDPLLLGALARCYQDGQQRRDSGRARSTADIERNASSGALTRADLGWRALLHALPELPRHEPRSPRSVLLQDQGYAVFRRENDVYAGFEFGQSGGGHGHPDRLNLTLYRGATRILDDMGTGSYVDPSLHWFRSTLAHNAPLVNGWSQPLRDGELAAHDEREGLGWIVGSLHVPEGDVYLERAVVVTPDYLIDEVRWSAPAPVRLELPWHMDPDVPAPAHPAAISGGARPEDGFGFLTKAHRVGAAARHDLQSRHDDVGLTVLGDQPCEVFFASGPGQPPGTQREFALVRAAPAASGRIRSVLSWMPVELRADAESLVVTLPGDEEHRHRRDERGWHVEFSAGGARSSIDLAGFVQRPVAQSAVRAVPHAALRIHRSAAAYAWLSEQRDPEGDHLLVWHLGERHYRRSELGWHAAGAPGATVAVSVSHATLHMHAIVNAGDALFAAPDARNDYDNEHADTMAAGVQLHLRVKGTVGAWMLVPQASGGTVRVRTIAPSTLPGPTAQWRSLSQGYEMRIDWPLPPGTDALSLDLLINETTRGRERRRGQLVLSGAFGEWVYLRGDRQDAERLIPLVIVA